MQDYLLPRFTPEEIKQISILSLAHIGDAAYELLVRTWLCGKGPVSSRTMHKSTVQWVSATAQAAAAGRIMGLLSEQERSVFMRGRNAQSKTIPKNADRGEYQHATGLEALFGYLYLSGSRQRMNELFMMIIDEQA